MSTKKTLMMAGLVAGMLFGNSAFAGGFQMYSNQSPEALALGGAVSARSDLLSNAFFNPAALGYHQNDSAIQVNFGAIKMNSERRPLTGSAVADGSYRMETDELELIGSLFYFQRINADWSFSLSVNAPYGMATHWHENKEISSVDYDLACIYISPSIIYNITKDFSISLGADLVYSQVKLGKGYEGAPSIGSGMMVAEGDDYGYGWHASAFYRINEFWTIGAKYQSSVLLKFTGDIDARGVLFDGTLHNVTGGLVGKPNMNGADVRADLRLPQSLSFGVATTYFSNWILSAEAVWTDWSSFKDITLHYDNGVSSEEKNWHSVMSYRLGAQYNVNENWALRFGWCYDNSPVPDSTRERSLPGSDYNEFSFGVKYSQKNWSIDAGYAILIFDSSKEVKGGVTEAEYHHTYLHILSAGFTYKF